jgi:hypothetical protein
MTASNVQHLPDLETVADTAQDDASKQRSEEDYSSDEDFLESCLDGLGPYDVVCGRQKEAFRNVGNRRFRVTVSLFMEKYVAAPTRQCKSKVISAVAEQVQANGGRFLRRRNNEWVELDDKQAKEKVGHALRDMASARESVLSRKALNQTRVDVGFVRNPNFFRPLTRRTTTADDSTACSSSESRSLDVNSHSADMIIEGGPPPGGSSIDGGAVSAGIQELSHEDPMDSGHFDWDALLEECEED